MRALADMDTIQIELTDACINTCSNCTRFCGHRKPFFLSEEQFHQALDSMIGYPKMTGFMGGEPLLHPKFAEFCKYAQSRIPKQRLGLWTCLPKGYEHHREIICETFEHIFINDHTRQDIFHAPLLVASEEVITDRKQLFYVTNKCWIQECWSAAINPKGAFFCEIAASMSILFDGPGGWPVEPEWWTRVPKDFTSQIEEWCPKCGAALPLPRRVSIEQYDDISPGNLERLKGKSLKIKRGLYHVSDLKLVQEPQPMATYKDYEYRCSIALRYKIGLEPNTFGFLTPYLLDSQSGGRKLPVKSIFNRLKEEYEHALTPQQVEGSVRLQCQRADACVQEEGEDRHEHTS